MERVVVRVLVTLALAICASGTGCGSATVPSPPASDGGGGGGVDAPGTDVPVAHDVSAPEVACGIDCAAPPPGCRYVGPVTCNPPSCGSLECPDAGDSDAAVDASADVAGDVARDVPGDTTCVIDCPAPPPGCHYEGVVSCMPPSCGTLVCPDAGAPVVCGAGGGGSFPMFDRRCTAASDCTIAVHQTDCCGNSHALGIRADQRMAFTAAETTCDGMYPRCGCPARPTVADDGMVAIPPATLAVDCRVGVCTTFVQP